jgi:hypothetical protein
MLIGIAAKTFILGTLKATKAVSKEVIKVVAFN